MTKFSFPKYSKIKAEIVGYLLEHGSQDLRECNCPAFAYDENLHTVRLYDIVAVKVGRTNFVEVVTSADLSLEDDLEDLSSKEFLNELERLRLFHSPYFEEFIEGALCESIANALQESELDKSL